MTPQLRIDTTLSLGTRFKVSRGWDLAADRPVIIKQFNGLHPSAAEVSSLTRELAITRHAADDAVVKAHSLIEHHGAVSLVLEDFGGRALSGDWDVPLSLIEILSIASQVAKGLATIHSRDIVHRDVGPSNIVYNRESGVAKLIEFGLAQVTGHASIGIQRATEFRGSALYASPEQTGRMNRRLDYRSDFYSLGATLYHLISGRPPFEGTTLLELFHAHLAKNETPLHELDPTVPETVSDIVATLLAKHAEDRYQSASGLAHDLKRAREELEATGSVSRFPLRELDIDERLHIPEKLYGRADEVAVLLRSFEQAAAGPAGVLHVAGYSGIGKTSLVHEVLPALSGVAAGFASGKLDQFERGTPYASLLQALRSRVLSLLTEDSAALDRWRTQILDRVGATGASVLLEVLPGLEHVVGPHPAPEPLMPAEARNRFQLAIGHLVQSLATADHPLVIFLDDLQWADLASIELVTQLATDPDGRHVLFIGAYRDNEVDHDHPLTSAIEQMRARGARLEEIVLGPLGLTETRQLVSDATVGAEDSDALADICHAKTHGNAFFLKRFLESLATAGHLRFDKDRRAWTWDLEAIEELAISENVVDFFSTSMRALPATTQRALGLAACIGDRFDIDTLGCALDLGRIETLAAVRTPVAKQLLQPASDRAVSVMGSDDIARDPPEPGAHRRVALIGLRTAQCDHKHVLGEVIGRGRVPRAGHAVPADVRQVLAQAGRHPVDGRLQDLWERAGPPQPEQDGGGGREVDAVPDDADEEGDVGERRLRSVSRVVPLRQQRGHERGAHDEEECSDRPGGDSDDPGAVLRPRHADAAAQDGRRAVDQIAAPLGRIDHRVFQAQNRQRDQTDPRHVEHRAHGPLEGCRRRRHRVVHSSRYQRIINPKSTRSQASGDGALMPRSPAGALDQCISGARIMIVSGVRLSGEVAGDAWVLRTF